MQKKQPSIIADWCRETGGCRFNKTSPVLPTQTEDPRMILLLRNVLAMVPGRLGSVCVTVTPYPALTQQHLSLTFP